MTTGRHILQMTGRGLLWLLRQDTALVLGLILLGTLTWSFLELVEETAEADTLEVEAAILQAFREGPDGTDPVGPLWVERAVLDLSALGSGAVVTLFVIVVSGFLLLDRKPRLCLLLIVCAGGSAGMMQLLKDLFERGRPDVVAPVYVAHGMSFPSGHAMISAALYSMLGVLLARTVPQLRLQLYIILSAAGFALIIGVTRIYLGVHYPTDVVAGWTLGLAWALVCGLAARLLQRRGIVEDATKAEGG